MPAAKQTDDKLFRALEIMFFITLVATSGEISLRDIALGLLFIIYLTRKIYRRDLRFVRTEYHNYILVFFLFSLFSLLRVEDLNQAIHAIVTPIFSYIVFYFMVLEIIDIRKIPRYVGFLYGGNLLFLGYGLYLDHFTSERFFLSGNSRGTFAGFIVILSLTLLVTRRGKFYHRLLYGAGFLLGLFALFSHSRGAIVGFIAGIILWALLYLVKEFSWQRLVIAVVLLAVIFTAFYSSDAIFSRFDRIMSYQDDSSITTRLQMWRTSLRLIRENPLLGIGAGNFNPTALRYVEEVLEENPWSSHHLHPHNLYLQIPLEQGIISLVIFLILVVKSYYIALKNYLFYPEKSWPFFAALAFLAMLTAILGHSFFDFPFNRTFNGFPLILLAVINLLYFDRRRRANQS